MFTTTVRGMLAHKVRLLLTTASIALGVAFLAGTLVLTDTMNLAFTQLFGQVSSGTDAVVRTEAAYTESAGVGTARSPLDASLLSQVRKVDGVRAAEGSVSGYALLTDNDGKAVLSKGGAPTLGYNLPDDHGLRGDVGLLSGSAPHGPGEVAIDATSAQEHHIALGSTIKVLFKDATRPFHVVGTVGFGGEKDLGGTTSAYFDDTTAQQVLGKAGTFDAINVSASDGVSQKELASRVEPVLPKGTEAVTGKAVAQESADAINEELGFVGVMFMIFAGIALFVGGFIIWNTFTMIVTQRSREIALMRAIGSTRRQVLRGLLTEAVLLGTAASAMGIVLGVGVAKGLNALMDVLGFSLPSTSLQLEPRTVWVSMLVGVVVTVASALVPARRATKVLPIQALRESVPGADAPSRVRALVGVAIMAAGVASILWNLYGDAAGIWLGVGLLASVLGVIVALPTVARTLASVVGRPLGLRGLPGELARQNAMRNPRRTASTAAALMIGLTLVVSMGVFASSLKASFGDVLGDSTKADLFVTSSSPQAEGFSPAVLPAVQRVDGIETLSASGWGQARFAGQGTAYSSVDPATAAKVMNLDLTAGSMNGLGRDGVAVSTTAAKAHHWSVGDTVTSEFPSSGKHPLRVAAIYANKGWVGGDYLISRAAQTAFAGPQLVSSALVTLEPGADLEKVQASIASAIADHPDATVLDKDGYEQQASGFIDQLLTFVTVMLLLAVIIALLGIVNTLVLSVFERTRELGLLRAVGMTRGQVRAMVRWESVVISLIGAITGAALGIGLGVALSQALKDEGIKAISVPGPQIVVYVALAAVAGVLAALGPARSAARVDVLKAVVTD